MTGPELRRVPAAAAGHSAVVLHPLFWFWFVICCGSCGLSRSQSLTAWALWMEWGLILCDSIYY